MGKLPYRVLQMPGRSEWAVIRTALLFTGYILLGCTALLLAFFIYIMFQSKDPRCYLEAQTKQNLHSIQLALESYAVDHGGLYPQDVATLAPHYIGTLPVNPFPEGDLAVWKWWLVKSEFTQHPVYMRDIPFGDPLFEGNFTYLPWGITAGDEAVGYYLIAYGSRKNQGQDLDGDCQDDHVIRRLESPYFRVNPDGNQQLIAHPDIRELLQPKGE